MSFLKKTNKPITILMILFTVFYLITFNFTVQAYESPEATDLVIEKISNPDAGEGEADGLVEGGDRETSYAWAMASRGNYIYIGTNKNIVGSVADTFVKAMESSGVNADTAWALINAMTNNEIPRPTTEHGGEIFKFDKDTGEVEKIYTADAGVAFRMAVEFDGDLYFASYSSVLDADNYIYKIDENDEITIAFTSSNGTSLRASCVYDGALLFGGVDARTELEEGYEDYQKLAILQKDAEDDTKWDRIADYKDFGEYAADPAVSSTIASPIWDICTYDGYVYATIPNSYGFVMFKGHPAESGEEANEYGWYWEEVIGKYNGVNNLGLAEEVNGYTGEEAGLISMTATPIVFKDKLYLIDFDNTIQAEVSAVTGIVQTLAWQVSQSRPTEQQIEKPVASEFLKTMYITLNHPQNLWCMDNETGKFELVPGFTEKVEGTSVEYVWRADIYNDQLYITTMDSAILYNYITNLKGINFTDLTEEDITELNNQIDELISSLGILGSSEQVEQIKTLLENLKALLTEYISVADDNKAFFDYVVENKTIIDQIAELGSMDDSILGMLEQTYPELLEYYNKVDWEGLKMYAYIGDILKKDVWGFDLLRTADGENFETVTDSGFDDKYNYGGRSIITTDKGLYVGTANPFYGAQLWRITENTENPDPENPDPENPDPENPDPENPDPENPDPENPDPENPDPENPNPENPDPENPDPENPDSENPDQEIPDVPSDIEDDWKDQVKDPDKLNDGMDDINNQYGTNLKDPTTSNNKLPATGINYFIIVGVLAILIVGFLTYKYIRYRDIDKY